jgi:signal transduction histidine kinase/DNA-binding response OmpR family regulator
MLYLQTERELIKKKYSFAIISLKTMTTKSVQRIILPLIFFLSVNIIGHAQKKVFSSLQKFPVNLTPSIEILRDSTAKLKLEQVATMKFKEHDKNYFIFPYSDDVFWVRLTLTNSDLPNKDWHIMWSNPLVEQLDFYISDSLTHGFLHKQQKIITSERDKKFIQQDPKFDFSLEAQETKTIYIKLTSKRGHYGTLKLYSTKAYYQSRIDDFAGEGFLNGLIFFRLFLVLALSFFIIKNLPFRLYSLYTVIRTFNYWGYLNIAGPLFTDNPDMAKKIDFLFYNSGTFGAGIFILTGFVINKLPKWNIASIGVILAFNAFINTIIFFDYQWYWLKAGAYTIVFSAFYYIVMYVYCVIKKIQFAKYYAILFIIGLSSTFLLYVRLLGWIEYQPIYVLSYYFFLGEIFIFVFFLGRIIRDSELYKAIVEQKLNFNLEQNKRLTELDNLKTTFFTNISHELRTPLTLLVGPLADLAQKFPSEWSVSVMQRNVARLQRLINQLLDLSKLEAGKLDILIRQDDMAAFLRQIFASFESLAQSKQIIFQYNQSQHKRNAYFDANKIETITINLLSNAFKFTPQNGRILVNVNYEETKVKINIKDFGIGISAEKLPFIYDRFYQANTNEQPSQAYEGTGIGLALVKELVEILKGSIAVKSIIDEGTEFEILLPIDKATWNNKQIITDDYQIKLDHTFEFDENTEVNLVETNRDIPVLLIVEDNTDLRSFIKHIFADKYQIIEAVNGQKGFEKAIELIPDMIITDLMMPVLDGIGFCKELKSEFRTSHIPVIMLTAKATNDDRLKGLELGADDYLTKPFDANELKIRVKNLITQRENLRLRYSKSSTLTEINDEPLANAQLPVIDEKFLQKTKTVIDKNLDKSTFDVEAFAEEMNMSSVQLRRKLKALTNETVTEYVRNYRLDIAADMLKSKAATVSEIAYRVGFESLPYFSKVFNEKFGKTPSEWK